MALWCFFVLFQLFCFIHFVPLCKKVFAVLLLVIKRCFLISDIFFEPYLFVNVFCGLGKLFSQWPEIFQIFYWVLEWLLIFNESLISGAQAILEFNFEC
jgi:hypothetical protein